MTENNVTQTDIKFWIFLIGAVASIIVWGTNLQNKVNAQEERIENIRVDGQEILKLLHSIDVRLLKIEIINDVEDKAVEELKKSKSN